MAGVELTPIQATYEYPTERPNLLSLPEDVRQLIYDYHFADYTVSASFAVWSQLGVEISLQSGIPLIYTTDKRLYLLRVCRTIFSEARSRASKPKALHYTMDGTQGPWIQFPPPSLLPFHFHIRSLSVSNIAGDENLRSAIKLASDCPLVTDLNVGQPDGRTSFPHIRHSAAKSILVHDEDCVHFMESLIGYCHIRGDFRPGTKTKSVEAPQFFTRGGLLKIYLVVYNVLGVVWDQHHQLDMTADIHGVRLLQRVVIKGWNGCLSL